MLELEGNTRIITQCQLHHELPSALQMMVVSGEKLLAELNHQAQKHFQLPDTRRAVYSTISLCLSRLRTISPSCNSLNSGSCP